MPYEGENACCVECRELPIYLASFKSLSLRRVRDWRAAQYHCAVSSRGLRYVSLGRASVSAAG